MAHQQHKRQQSMLLFNNNDNHRHQNSRKAKQQTYTNESNDAGQLFVDLLSPPIPHTPTSASEANPTQNNPVNGSEGSSDDEDKEVDVVQKEEEEVSSLEQNSIVVWEETVTEEEGEEEEEEAAEGGNEGDGGVGEDHGENAIEEEPSAPTESAADTENMGKEDDVDYNVLQTTNEEPSVALSESGDDEEQLQLDKNEISSSTESNNDTEPSSATSYQCNSNSNISSSTSVSEGNTRIVKRVIQYDYDLLLTAPLDSAAAAESPAAVEEQSNISSIIQQLEKQLLEHVGTSLNGLGLCATTSLQPNDSVRLLRGASSTNSNGIVDNNDYETVRLKELSSLPADEILGDDEGE